LIPVRRSNSLAMCWDAATGVEVYQVTDPSRLAAFVDRIGLEVLRNRGGAEQPRRDQCRSHRHFHAKSSGAGRRFASRLVFAVIPGSGRKFKPASATRDPCPPTKDFKPK